MSVLDMAEVEPEEEQGGGRKKMLLVGVLVVALAAAAWWWFMMRPAAADQEPEPGEVLQLEPIQVNLEDGHYLRIGIALQAVEGAHEIEGSKALDATIELFTGESVESLANEKHRHRLKDELVEQLEESYEEEVIGVYFTDFVTQ